ncbi:hypothetical protein [Mesorhizobium sp. WSM2239]|uniref:Uncharacterized protein n=2 Tax=unclassified Mesorhizobium TaxID=325217 RepID=A0AAU8DEH3_9HYPH
MSSNIDKGQKVLSLLARQQAAGVVGNASNLSREKLAAWELAAGIRSPVAHPPGRAARPHRGNLPDVDISLAVPFPTKPSRVSMIAGWVRNVFRDPAKEERRYPFVRNL